LVYQQVEKRAGGKGGAGKQRPLLSGRVLLADDNATDPQILRSQLTALECNATSAASGEEALQFLPRGDCGRKTIRARLYRHANAGMNGMELAQALKSDPITKIRASSISVESMMDQCGMTFLVSNFKCFNR